jgi:hypothetical protein
MHERLETGHERNRIRRFRTSLLRTRPRTQPDSAHSGVVTPHKATNDPGDGLLPWKWWSAWSRAHAVPSFLTLYMACTPRTASTPHAAWVLTRSHRLRLRSGSGDSESHSIRGPSPCCSRIARISAFLGVPTLAGTHVYVRSLRLTHVATCVSHQELTCT